MSKTSELENINESTLELKQISNKRMMVKETEDIRSLLNNYFDENGIDDAKLYELLMPVVKRIEKLSSIDKKLARTIRKDFGKNLSSTAEDIEQFKMNLKDDDFMLYFKDADTFTKMKEKSITPHLVRFIYEGEKLNHGENMYEIIRDDKPQKIQILSSGKLSEKTKLVQQYICDFMEEKGHKIKKSEIKCVKNKETGYVEIIITKYYVKNNEGRDIFVSELKKYIKRVDGDKNVLKLLDKKDCEDFGIKNTRANLMSRQKEHMDGTQISYKTANDMADMIVSAINNQCKLLDVGSGNQIFVNINSNNINSNNIVGDNSILGDNSSVNVADPEEIYVKIFKKLVSMKPKWYVMDKELYKSSVYKNIMQLVDLNIPEKTFWQHMKKRIIRSERRAQHSGKRTMYVTLKNIF